jgi:hypothetical protein
MTKKNKQINKNIEVLNGLEERRLNCKMHCLKQRLLLLMNAKA